MFFIGADPDLHTTGIALVSDNPADPIKVWCIEVEKDVRKGRDAAVAMIEAINRFSGGVSDYFAVEAQEIYQGAGQDADTKNPRSILWLGHVAGALFFFLNMEAIEGYFPSPQEWKGTVPKQIHQARILTSLRIPYEKVGKDPRTGYCRPTDFSRFQGEVKSKTHWKHLIDALGLALWAKDQYHLQVNKQRTLAALQ